MGVLAPHKLLPSAWRHACMFCADWWCMYYAASGWHRTYSLRVQIQERLRSRRNLYWLHSGWKTLRCFSLEIWSLGLIDWISEQIPNVTSQEELQWKLQRAMNLAFPRDFHSYRMSLSVPSYSHRTSLYVPAISCPCSLKLALLITADCHRSNAHQSTIFVRYTDWRHLFNDALIEHTFSRTTSSTFSQDRLGPFA